MKGDFTRLNCWPEKHFSSVRLQQGRVLLDAEWNEQVDIQAHLDQTTTTDVVGHCGAPLHNAGFELLTPPNSNVWTGQIGAGRYYVDGILCENEQAVAFTAQPDLPGVALPPHNGTYLAYLDVWQRHLTALEQSELREVALGGPDTATRTKTIWQVKLETFSPTITTCAQIRGDWTPVNTQSTGQLRARAEPAQPSSKECIVPPGAGYRRLENQLYRVEIHTPGAPNTATYKWSRDNGSIVARLSSISGTSDSRVVTVDDPGKDSVLGFAGARFVELSDEGRTLRGEPGELLEVTKVQGSEITVKIVGTPHLNFGAGPTVRRWDGMGTVSTGAWIDLEDGVQVGFSAGDYRTGDYWLIPARSLSESHPSGGVEWPQDNTGPKFEKRRGIQHHYCPLALLTRTSPNNVPLWTRISDCRKLFPPLTSGGCSVTVGKDGQYPDINSALTDLSRSGSRDWCICLLSGEHRWSGTVPDAASPGRPIEIHMQLVGCGRSTHLELQGPMTRRGWTSFALRHMEIDVVFNPGNSPGAIAFGFDRCDEVTIESCYLAGVTQSYRNALITLKGSDRVRFRDNVFEASLSGSLNTPVAIFNDADEKLKSERVTVDFVEQLFRQTKRKCFNQTVVDVALQLAAKGVEERGKIAVALGRALHDIQSLSRLTRSEQNSYLQFMEAIKRDNLTSEAHMLVDLLKNIRTAAIKASPGVAIILESVTNESEFAEALDEDDVVVIENNDIIGIVSLYGIPGSETLTPYELSSLKTNRQYLNIRGFMGTLRLHGNQLVRLTVADAVIKVIKQALSSPMLVDIDNVFGRCLLTENIIEGRENMVVSGKLTLSANTFTMFSSPGVSGNPTPAFRAVTAIADASVILGNLGGYAQVQLWHIARGGAPIGNVDMTLMPP